MTGDMKRTVQTLVNGFNDLKLKGKLYHYKPLPKLLQSVAAPRIFPSGGKLGVTWQFLRNLRAQISVGL